MVFLKKWTNLSGAIRISPSNNNINKAKSYSCPNDSKSTTYYRLQYGHCACFTMMGIKTEMDRVINFYTQTIEFNVCTIFYRLMILLPVHYHIWRICATSAYNLGLYKEISCQVIKIQCFGKKTEEGSFQNVE